MRDGAQNRAGTVMTPQATSLRRSRPTATLVVAFVIASSVACSTVRPSGPTPTGGTPEPATSSAVSSASVNQSPSLQSVEVKGEGGTSLKLTLMDRSGAILHARSATVPELRAHDTILSTTSIAAINLDARQLLLMWLGSACDQTAILDVDADLVEMKLENGPRPACDLIANPRGLVLEMPGGVQADQISLELRQAPAR